MTSVAMSPASVRIARLTGLAAILAAALLDQASKLFAIAMLEPGQAQSLLPFFNLRLSFNHGISFSLFTETFATRPWLLASVTLAMTSLFAVLLMRSTSKIEAAGLGLIIGGALGNAADRFRIGAVVDFLDVFAGTYHWPAFNIADTAITFGVVLLLAGHLTGPSQHPKEQT